MRARVKSDPAAASTALVHRGPDRPEPGDVRLQKLWLALQRRTWRSLAVLPASSSIDTLHIAELLAKLAWSYRGQSSSVFDLRDLSMRLVEYHQREVLVQVNSGAFVVMALSSTLENPTAIPMARSADAVALCIDLGHTDFASVEQTVEEVGSDRVLGAILVRGRDTTSAR